MANNFDSRIHHRRSIRLKDYDYSQAGAYFVTICVQDMLCLLGHVSNDEMILNDAGKMVDAWCRKLPEKFSGIKLDECQLMPNHIHFILVNTSGAEINSFLPEQYSDTQPNGDGEPTFGEHPGPPLKDVIGWFKTMSTNEYIRNVKTNNWPPFNRKLFQRNYWEHIIRNEVSYNHIADYIRNNPSKWTDDRFFRK